MKPIALLLLVLLLTYPGLAAADSAASNAPAESALLNLDIKDISVKDAVAKLFEGRAEGYFLGPGATGKITELKLKGITLEQGLKAIADAAGLTYKTEDGIYVIESKSATAVMALAATTTSVTMAQPTPAPAPSSAQQPAPAAAPPANSTQVVINSQPGPVFYGNPSPDSYGGYGYGYQQPYQVGNVQVLPGGWGSGPVMVTGAGPYFIGRTVPPPPPPGWVSPDVLRFMRYQYILPSRPYAGMGGYGWY